MDFLLESLKEVRSLLPFAGTTVLVVLLLLVAERVLKRVGHDPLRRGFRNQLTMLGLSFAGLIVIVLALPVSDTTRGQLLSLIGILLTAAIALSSTTLLGNGMAGIMLRAVRNFRSGDFIRCEGHLGRVSQRGLFHTEIQTPDRELTTLPNLFLATHPVTVVRSSGTVVSATVSLGYDVSRRRVEAALIEAATRCELDDPFVHVMELGDFSITYRVAGLLEEVKHLISTQSRLRGACIDALHEASIEIVSPSFMNTRAFDAQRSFVPERSPDVAADEQKVDSSVEDLVFDKAEEAESREDRIHRLEKLEARIDAMREEIKRADDGSVREAREASLAELEQRRDSLREALQAEGERSD